MDLTYQYLKKRATFGRQTLFLNQGPELCDSINMNKAEHKKFILRNPVHEAIQNVPNFSEHDVNTLRVESKNCGANHAEGGWPKDVNVQDVEGTQRYRRKIEKEDGYINCVVNLSPNMQHYVKQNNAIDMYQTYFTSMVPLDGIENLSMRTLNVFHDPHKRPVNSISWEPNCGYSFAASYVDVDFYGTPKGSTSAFVWNANRTDHPELILTPPDVVYDLKYSPRDPNVLCGGLGTGQVAGWDKRRGGNPTGISATHTAHRFIVSQVLFINSKSGLELFSSGPDGVCKWWDLRKIDEPIDEIIIDVVESAQQPQRVTTAYGVTVLEFEPTIPTRFMVGTENGLVIGGNRKGKTPMEKLPIKMPCHDGPVWSLQRNPIFLKYFLTVGDWTVKVWSEECRESAVLWSPPQRHRFTAGNWSPTKLSLMVLSGMDGKLSCWDFLKCQYEPVLTMQLPQPILKQSFHDVGVLLAAGSNQGNIFMVEMSDTLVQSKDNDKTLLLGMLERESKRERILEARLREIRLKMKQGDDVTPKTSAADMDPTIGDRDLNEATNSYMSQVKKDLTIFH